jgi:hypothetical protein
MGKELFKYFRGRRPRGLDFALTGNVEPCPRVRWIAKYGQSLQHAGFARIIPANENIYATETVEA